MSKHRFTPKLGIKKGDSVVVISGAQKGKEGEVIKVFPKENRAILQGVNLVKKHVKSTNEVEGGIKEIEAPIHISNLMLKDPKTGEPTRIGRKLVDGVNVRYSKKTGEIIK